MLIRRRKPEGDPDGEAVSQRTIRKQPPGRTEPWRRWCLAVFGALRPAPGGTEPFSSCLKLAEEVELIASRWRPSASCPGEQGVRIPLNHEAADAVLARSAPV